MKATISKLCMGDRNCNKLCPEVFEYDEDQLLSIVKYDEIPKHLEAIVRQAAREVPRERPGEGARHSTRFPRPPGSTAGALCSPSNLIVRTLTADSLRRSSSETEVAR